jgi:hypothetical protein
MIRNGDEEEEPMDDKLTEDEYRRRMAALQDAAEPARRALSDARAEYERICDEMTALRAWWHAQQQGEAERCADCRAAAARKEG